jgi:hypothetical protein
MSFGIPTRNGLPSGLGSVMSLAAAPASLVSPGAILSPLTLTRAQASGALSTGELQTWQTYGADTPRFVFPNGALLIEGQRTNSIRNPRGAGGVTSPTNWDVFSAAGLTTSIAGRGVENGRDYVDLRFNGTTTGSFRVQTFDSAPTSVTAGQLATGSSWVSLVAGSLANISANYLVLRWSAGGVSFVQYTPTATPTRVVVTGTVPAAATTVFLTQDIGFAIGAAIDVTLRFSWPQLETTSGFVSTPILPPVGAPAATTRGADLVSASLANLGIGANGAGTVLITCEFTGLDATSIQRLLVVDNGTQNNAFGFQQQSGNSLRVFRTTAGAGATATDTTTAVVGTQLKIGITADGAGRVAASVNGGAAIAVTGAPTSGLTTLRLGNDASGTTPFFGETNVMRVLPFTLSDTELQAAVAALPSS